MCLAFATTESGHPSSATLSRISFPKTFSALPHEDSLPSRFLGNSLSYPSYSLLHILSYMTRTFDTTSLNTNHISLDCDLTLILRRCRTGTVWFYTSTSNKRAARPKLYTKSLTRDLKLMYSRFTLVRISIKL